MTEYKIEINGYIGSYLGREKIERIYNSIEADSQEQAEEKAVQMIRIDFPSIIITRTQPIREDGKTYEEAKDETNVNR